MTQELEKIKKQEEKSRTMKDEIRQAAIEKYPINNDISCFLSQVESSALRHGFIEGAEWKDKKFTQLIESELKRWSKGNDSCEAKYRIEMLKELIEKLNEY